MWEYLTLERAEARKILADASREIQEGIQDQWQQESPFREFLEQVKRSEAADCAPRVMRRGYLAMKNGCWEAFQERYRKEGKSSEWTFEGIREAHEKVAKDEIGRFGIVQEIQRKSTEFLRRIIAPVWNGRSHFVVWLPTLQQFPLGGPHLVGFFRVRWQQQQKVEALQLALCGLWRALRMESAQQRTGGAARCECQWSEGVWKRTQRRWSCVATWSMRWSCLRTSRKMVTARFKASSQACMKAAEKVSWRGSEVSSKRITIVRWTWVFCVNSKGRSRSRSGISVRITQRRPSGKERMS